MMRLKDEQLAQDRNNMSTQFMSQIAAVHQVERATARVGQLDKKVVNCDKKRRKRKDHNADLERQTRTNVSFKLCS
eukprot:419654-Pelagomonas_calceolata.AAC.3